MDATLTFLADEALVIGSRSIDAHSVMAAARGQPNLDFTLDEGPFGSGSEAAQQGIEVDCLGGCELEPRQEIEKVRRPSCRHVPQREPGLGSAAGDGRRQEGRLVQWRCDQERSRSP